ncbi:putative transporter svop-1 isoform X3 [Drosophila grimshawi]|nr:putative transporter svop-1 isoform X3 [Drosophila grimshawi]
MPETETNHILTLIGFGRIQFLMVFACGMSGLYTTNEVMGISSMLVSIGCDFSMTKNDLSLMASAAFLGLVVSSHYWGYQADSTGRRKIMLYSLSLTMTSSIISLSMPNFYMMLIWRFITGLFVSGVSVTFITYLMEFTPIKNRPRMVNVMTYSYALGGIYVPLLAHALEPLNQTLFSVQSFDMLRYRFNMMLNTIPGICALISMCILPPSPQFMLLKGETDLAYQILNRLCVSNRGQDLQSLGVDRLNPIRPTISMAGMQEYNFFQRLVHDTVPLFNNPYLKPFLHVTVILCCFFFVGTSLTLWFMEMRQRFPASDLILCDMIHSRTFTNASDEDSLCSTKPLDYLGGVGLGCSVLIICFAITIMLFFLPRSLVLLCNATISVICGLMLNILTSKTAIFIAIVTFIAMCTCSIPLASSVMVDVVPTGMRGKAVSLSYMFGRIGVIISTNIIGNLMSSHCHILLNGYVLITTVSAILSLLLPYLVYKYD